MRLLKIVLGLVLFLPSCSRETKERENVIGYMGRARMNPYLAAERYLAAGDRKVVSSSGILKLDESEAVVFAPASSVRSVGDAERILRWVKQGGHFVCFIDRGEEFWNDIGDSNQHEPQDWSLVRSDQSGLSFLLDSLELYLVNEPYEEEFLESDDGTILDNKDVAKGRHLPNAASVHVRLSSNDSFEALIGGSRAIEAVDNIYRQGDWYDIQDNHRFFSRIHGYDSNRESFMGRVTMISDARLFRNPYISFAQHAELLDAITAGDGNIIFSTGEVRSFSSLLGEYGSKPLWALFVLLVLWLWKSLPRFGPLLDVSHGHFRNYADQVSQVGQFYWRYRRSDLLVNVLRHEVDRKLCREFEDEQADLKYREIAEIAELDIQSVKEALHSEVAKDPNSMVRVTRNLQQILNSL